MVKINYTKYIILGLLSSGPMSGYEIRKWVKESISYVVTDFSYGQIYPMLATLDRAGLATVREEKSRGGRARKVYRITALGLAELQAWLRGPETGEYELLLKMCFGSQMPAAELIRKLETYKRKRQSETECMEQWLADLKTGAAYGPNTPYYYMITRLGRYYFKDEIAWCDESVAALKKLDRGS